MSGPVRIQRKRTKGWKMPPNTVSVARPGRWKNPFRVGGYFKIGATLGGGGVLGAMRCDWMERCIWKPSDEKAAVREGYTLIRSNEHAVAWFKRMVQGWGEARRAECRRELAGHNLACWCPLDQPCHADVLLELANATVPKSPDLSQPTHDSSFGTIQNGKDPDAELEKRRDG